jgi:hypothetical protein
MCDNAKSKNTTPCKIYVGSRVAVLLGRVGIAFYNSIWKTNEGR